MSSIGARESMEYDLIYDVPPEAEDLVFIAHHLEEESLDPDEWEPIDYDEYPIDLGL